MITIGRRSWVALAPVSVLGAIALAAPAAAQFPGLTLPPSGANQHSVVSQSIGPVTVTIDYNSPDVHGPSGEDRAGKIWGGLVPYGMANLGFGTCGDQCPWRGGANENTVFKVSHDVKVQGQTLPAGAYGLHFIPGEQEWTVIFSKNSTSWGSFFYDAKEDQLRVKAKPEKSPYHEWLTYEFTDRQPDKATVALAWENLALPLVISIDNVQDLYLAEIRQDLRTSPGFAWQNWVAAVQYCLQNNINLEEAVRWARHATDPSQIGQENFTTLSTLSQAQAAAGQTAEAAKTMDQALAHRTAGPVDIHMLGRQLLTQKKAAEAMKVFEYNATRYPGVWPTEVGLMRGHSAMGRNKEALEHGRKALAQAPDEGNRTNLQNLVKQLEEGKSIN
jgi:hypothetical protein